MIYAENGNFLLETAHTTYAFCVDPAGNLQHLYYGEKLSLGDSWQKALEALKMRIFNPNGCSIIQDPMHPAVSLDDVSGGVRAWKGGYGAALCGAYLSRWQPDERLPVSEF